MELIQISKEDFERYYLPFHVFNSSDFNELTARLRNTVVEYLAFKTNKYKLGIIGCIIGNEFISPFSAPFGGFSYGKEDVTIEQIDTVVQLLIDYCNRKKLSTIKITLPPLIYNPSFISRISDSLFRSGFTLFLSELNYSINTTGSIEKYEELLHRNARKNLGIAKKKDYNLIKCQTQEEKILAYEIIKTNRYAKGYKLAMTKEDVLQTIKVIEADFFLLKLDTNFVASAIIFRTAPQIVQVVYWGDLPEYSLDKPINYLAYSLVEYYLKEDVIHIDIGPSTIDGKPNYGLCNFKESIGCEAYPKYSYSYKI